VSRLRIDTRYLLLMKLLIGSLMQRYTRNWIWKMPIIKYALNQKMNGRLRSARGMIFLSIWLCYSGLLMLRPSFKHTWTRLLKAFWILYALYTWMISAFIAANSRSMRITCVKYSIDFADLDYISIWINANFRSRRSLS
jgi:hypothetical protein